MQETGNICKGVFFMKELVKVVLPEGCFMGNCATCYFADRYDTKEDGRVKCNNKNYGGYNYPKDRNGCIHYVDED